MKNKRDDDVFCSSGKDESQSVLYILRVEDAISMRNRLYYFCWATLHAFLRFIASHRYSLAQVAGLFSMKSR